MATQTFKAAVNGAKFPFRYSRAGRGVITTDLDQSPRVPVSYHGTSESIDYNMIELLAAENALPTAKGMVSCGLTEALGTFSAIVEPVEPNVFVMLHGDTADGSIIDSSTYNHSMVSANPPGTGETSGAFTARAMYFSPGGNQYVSTTLLSAPIPMQTGNNFNWTIECRFKLDASAAGVTCGLFSFQDDAPQPVLWYVYVNSSGKLCYFCGNSGFGFTRITSLDSVSVNAWHHAALTRDSVSISLWLDGVKVGAWNSTGGGGSQAWNYAIDLMRVNVGSFQNTGEFMRGYIEEVRMDLGVARYSLPFTPPTIPYFFAPELDYPQVADQLHILRTSANRVRLLIPSGGANYVFNPATQEWEGNADQTQLAPFSDFERMVTTASVGDVALVCYAQSGIFQVSVAGIAVTRKEILWPPGVADSVVRGILATSNYLVAWTDSEILWSTPLNPLDFQDFDQGAGRISPIDIKGQISVCASIAGGFIAYTTKNAVGASFTNNARTPFVFQEVKNSGGVLSPKHLTGEYNGGLHYTWGPSGFQAVTLQEAVAQFPELSDAIHARVLQGWNDTEERILEVISAADLRVRLAYLSNRYLAISVGETGSISFEYAYVYDTVLQRWGCIRTPHTEMFTLPTVSAATDVRYSELAGSYASLGAATYSSFNAELEISKPGRGSMAILRTDGSVAKIAIGLSLNSLLIYGRVQVRRAQHVMFNSLELDGVEDTTEVYLLTSKSGHRRDGVYAPVGMPMGDANRRWQGRQVSVNFDVLVRGQFDLSSLVMVTQLHGKRAAAPVPASGVACQNEQPDPYASFVRLRMSFDAPGFLTYDSSIAAQTVTQVNGSWATDGVKSSPNGWQSAGAGAQYLGSSDLSANMLGEDSISGAQDFCIEMQVKANPPDAANPDPSLWEVHTDSAVFHSGWQSGSMALGYDDSTNPGALALYVYNYDVSTPLLLSGAVDLRDAVHHVAVIRNGTAWAIAVDGQEVAAATWNGVLNGGVVTRYFIGGNKWNATNNANAVIDDVKITKHFRYEIPFVPPCAFPLILPV